MVFHFRAIKTKLEVTFFFTYIWFVAKAIVLKENLIVYGVENKKKII